MKERIKWVDWTKTICMFLVILGHCHLHETYKSITTIIYTFHMPLFFFISGLLCRSNWSVKSLIKDIKFILIPYMTYGLISIFIDSFLSHRLSSDVIYTELIRYLMGYDISIGPIWFLPALFTCKQLFFLFRCIDYSHYTKLFLFITSLFPIYFIFHQNINLPFFIDSGICALPFFYFGHYSSEMTKKIKQLAPSSQIILFIIIILLLVPLGQLNGSVVIADCIYGNNLFLYYINAFIGIVLIIQISISLENKSHRIIYTFAYGSIVTLGIHGYILRFFHYYLPVALGYYKPTYSLLTALLYSTLVYTICFAIILVIDRTKLSNMFGLKGGVISPNK